jgi:hypothetical protein
MHLCDIPHDKIPSVEIPTGLPMIYDREKRRIRLLEDSDPSETIFIKNPLERYKFGSAPGELVFKVNHLTAKKKFEEMNEKEKMELYHEIFIKLPSSSHSSSS